LLIVLKRPGIKRVFDRPVAWGRLQEHLNNLYYFQAGHKELPNFAGILFSEKRPIIKL